jgi:hypothetical protein
VRGAVVAVTTFSLFCLVLDRFSNWYFRAAY